MMVGLLRRRPGCSLGCRAKLSIEASDFRRLVATAMQVSRGDKDPPVRFERPRQIFPLRDFSDLGAKPTIDGDQALVLRFRSVGRCQGHQCRQGYLAYDATPSIGRRELNG